MLRRRRDNDRYAADFPQSVKAPESLGKGIPTLKRGIYREPTPMLRARFEYCGSWTNAFPGLTWLGLGEMRSVFRTGAIDLVKTRQEYWDGSAPATVDWAQLSLFAIDEEEGCEVYLVWSGKPTVEPKLVWYEAQHESSFENLIDFLEYLLGHGKR
jgi:hypothetical protein